VPNVNVITPEGDTVAIPEETLDGAIRAGYKLESVDAANARATLEGKLAPYQGTGAAIQAGVQGALRGATLGLSDVLQRAGGTDAEDLRLLEQANPTVSTVGELGGGLATAILSGGTGALGATARLTPSGAVSQGALRLGERILGSSPSGVRQVAGYAISGAAEGAVQNVGSYISDVALENKELSAEGFLGSAGQGALWGGGAGGALAGIERGTIAARRLFPRSQVGDREALEIAEQTFRASADDTVRASDELQSIAETAAKDLRIRQKELALEREKLRGAKDAASRIRVKEIALEQEQLRALRKAERDAQNAARSARGLPDLPPEPAPQVPILDDVAPPTGPPAVTQSLAGADDLATRLAATKGLLDEGVPFADIGAAARAGDDLAISAKNTAHEADMLADDAARTGADAADRLEAKLGEFVDAKEEFKALIDPARKGRVNDWLAEMRAKAGPQKYRYENTDGSRIGGGAGRKTDRVRDAFDDGLDEQGSVYDRVWAGIGDDAPAPAGIKSGDTIDAGGKPLRLEAVTKKTPSGAQVTEIKAYRTLGDGEEVVAGQATFKHRGDELSPADVTVEPALQRKGVASKMYELAENQTGRRIIASETQTAQGRGLSEAYRARRDGLPRGFSLDAEVDGMKLFNPGAKVERGIPDYKALKAGDYRDTAYVLSPSDLTGRPLLGVRSSSPEAVATRIGSIRKARAEGKGLAALEVDMSPSGKLFVRDGNHRLLAAAEDGAPIAVRFRPVSEDVLEGADDIRALVADRMGGARRAGAELDAQYDDLIARAAQADGPDDLARIAKQAGDIEDEIFRRVEARGGRDAEQVAKIRANREKFGWTSSDVAARRAEKLAVAEPGVKPLSAKAAAESRDVAAFERVMRENQFGSGKTAGELAREMTAPPPRSLADDILGVGREAAPAPAIEVVDRTGGRFVADAEDAVRVIGNMERATYELAQELGPAAPPAIQRQASAYAAAVDDQSRKLAEATAMKADDVARSTALVSLPKPPATAPARTGGRLLDAFAAVDTVNEFASVIPGMPTARDIPVVGPLLSMYLKYRGGMAFMRRFGGRIPANSEAKVAARSAELRDKVAGIVDDLLMGASKGAKAARKPAVVGGVKLMDSLKFSLFPDGSEKKENKTPAEAVKARVRELSAAAANPDAVRTAVRQQVGAANPDLSAAIEAAVLRKLQYLQKHAPKAPPPAPLGTRPWNPSTSEIERFARRVRAAEDPASVLQDFEAGVLTPEAAETLRVVYPQMFAEVQARLLTRAAELEAKLPYQKVLQASLLFDVPLDTSLRPENLRLLQEAHASPAATGDPAQGQNAGPQPPAPPTPSVAGPVNLSRLYETPEMRRATRR
jgi:GNAT superfamily N-acetyltransferase